MDSPPFEQIAPFGGKSFHLLIVRRVLLVLFIVIICKYVSLIKPTNIWDVRHGSSAIKTPFVVSIPLDRSDN